MAQLLGKDITKKASPACCTFDTACDWIKGHKFFQEEPTLKTVAFFWYMEPIIRTWYHEQKECPLSYLLMGGEISKDTSRRLVFDFNKTSLTAGCPETFKVLKTVKMVLNASASCNDDLITYKSKIITQVKIEGLKTSFWCTEDRGDAKMRQNMKILICEFNKDPIYEEVSTYFTSPPLSDLSAGDSGEEASDTQDDTILDTECVTDESTKGATPIKNREICNCKEWTKQVPSFWKEDSIEGQGGKVARLYHQLMGVKLLLPGYMQYLNFVHVAQYFVAIGEDWVPGSPEEVASYYERLWNNKMLVDIVDSDNYDRNAYMHLKEPPNVEKLIADTVSSVISSFGLNTIGESLRVIAQHQKGEIIKAQSIATPKVFGATAEPPSPEATSILAQTSGRTTVTKPAIPMSAPQSSLSYLCVPRRKK